MIRTEGSKGEGEATNEARHEEVDRQENEQRLLVEKHRLDAVATVKLFDRSLLSHEEESGHLVVVVLRRERRLS